MIARQTWALLVDAYRDLNSRKLFWLVLILNVLVVAGFATVGVRGNQIVIINWVIPQELPFALFLYKWVFAQILVGQWLTWAATVLALISTASIFPDFMAGGSIDLYLSKPIGRLRLFLTKYATGLMFVLLQVTVFTVCSFFVLGWRGKSWEPGLFLAIPIVVLFFSYLFSMAVLFGVLTRSAMGSFFLTIIAWFTIFGINQADAFMLQADRMYAEQAKESQRRLVQVTSQITALEEEIAKQPTTGPTSRPSLSWLFLGRSEEQRLQQLKQQRERLEQRAEEDKPPGWVKTAQPILFGLNTLVPKTHDTIALLNRVLFDDRALQMALEEAPRDDRRHDGPDFRRQIERVLHGRGVWWIIGSSVAFEAVILSLAAWRFCRRDY